MQFEPLTTSSVKANAELQKKFTEKLEDITHSLSRLLHSKQVSLMTPLAVLLHVAGWAKLQKLHVLYLS